MSCTYTVEYELVDPTRRDEAMALAAESKTMITGFGATAVHFYAQMTPTGGGRLFRYVAVFETMAAHGAFMDAIGSDPTATAFFTRFNAPDSPWRALTSFVHREVPLG